VIHASFAGVIDGQQPGTILKGLFILRGVVTLEVAPVTPRKSLESRHGILFGNDLGSTARDDYVPKRKSWTSIHRNHSNLLWKEETPTGELRVLPSLIYRREDFGRTPMRGPVESLRFDAGTERCDDAVPTAFSGRGPVGYRLYCPVTDFIVWLPTLLSEYEKMYSDNKVGNSNQG